MKPCVRASWSRRPVVLRSCKLPSHGLDSRQNVSFSCRQSILDFCKAFGERCTSFVDLCTTVIQAKPRDKTLSQSCLLDQGSGILGHLQFPTPCVVPCFFFFVLKKKQRKEDIVKSHVVRADFVCIAFLITRFTGTNC